MAYGDGRESAFPPGVTLHANVAPQPNPVRAASGNEREVLMITQPVLAPLVKTVDDHRAYMMLVGQHEAALRFVHGTA